MNRDFRTIVVTDVDDLPFDAEGRLRPSAAALRDLDRYRIPLIFWSSRTRAEIEPIREELGNRHPFFVENGSALYLPRNYFAGVPMLAYDAGDCHLLEFGCPRRHAVRALDMVAARLGIPVAPACEGPRHYDQPFRVVDDRPTSRSRMMRALRRGGLFVTRSSQSDHVNGVADPGAGLTLLRCLYEDATSGRVIVVGFGSAFNHVPLLREADISLVVRGTDVDMASRLLRKVPASRVAAGPGPLALKDTVMGIVDALGRAAAAHSARRVALH